MKQWLVVPCLCSILTAQAAMSRASTYSIIDLGTLGGSSSIASATNNNGQIVGYSRTANGDAQAFAWQNGAMTGLGTPGATSSWAKAINESGQIVGYAYEAASDTTRAVLWQAGTPVNLPTYVGHYSRAYAINDSGQIAGYSETSSVLWRDGDMTDLGSGIGFGINNGGQVVGCSSDQFGGSPHAVLWQDSKVIKLSNSYSYAYDINDAGQIVGYSYESGDCHAFLWANGVATDLGTLGGFRSEAWGISNSGQIVGNSYTQDGAVHAVLWQNGIMTDLGTLAGRKSFACGINDSGQIVGYSVSSTGDYHAVLWQPVPEPSSVFVILCGIGGIIWRRRK